MSIFGEIVARIRGWNSRRRPIEPAFDATPADGSVEIARIFGMNGEPNPLDSRFTQFVALETAADGENPARSTGRTSGLLGRVVFASLFLGRPGRGWKDEEIAKTHASLIRAGEWIESEAKRQNAAVNIEVADVYFAAIDPAPDLAVALTMTSGEFEQGLMDSDAQIRLVASASRAAATLGFHDVADLAKQVAERVVADKVIWFLHVRMAGRSFVVPERETGMKGVGFAICYARFADQPGRLVGLPGANSATFAHEALHLFGASDKYGVPLRRFPKGTVTARDIMRLETERLSQLRIDPATASEIGW